MQNQMQEKVAQEKDMSISNQAIILTSWRDMISELTSAGYTPYRLSRLIEMPINTIKYWFEGEQEIPEYELFARILYLYCHYKNKLH